MKRIFLVAAVAFSMASCGGGGNSTFQPGTITGNADVNLVACAAETNGPSATPSSFSMAISGAGNFVLNAGGEISLAKSGSFHPEIGNVYCGYVNGQLIPTFDGYLLADNGQRLSGYGLGNNGKPDTSRLMDVNVFSSGDMPPKPTTSMNAQLNLDSSASAVSSVSLDAPNAAIYQFSTLANFFDTLGNAHTLRLNFVKAAANTWDVFAAGDDVASGPVISQNSPFQSAIAQLVFDANGALTSVAQAMSIQASDFPLSGGPNITSSSTTVLVAVPVTTGASTPVLFGLDFAGTTQKAGTFKTVSITQDGYATGRVNGFSIGPDGKIVSRYDNGQSRITGQVAIVPFL